jgi:hypothetical protein
MKDQKVHIDDQIVTVSDYQLSLLGYSLVSGKSRAFRLLTERFSASVTSMISEFSRQNLDPLNILAEKNFLDMMKVFLPLFFKNRPRHASIPNDTLDFIHLKEVKEDFIVLSPIQVACLHGSVLVIDFLYNFHLNYPDRMINIHEIHEETGEGCAFFAVRSGSLQTVKLLFEKYRVRFDGLNKFKENVLQVCALASSKKQMVGFFEVFVYLVEEVGVEFTWNYEEVLILLKDKAIVDYYQTVLRGKGIKALKGFIDLKNQVKPVKEKFSIDKFTNSPNFHIPDIDYVESSLISSISHYSKGTDFYTDSLGQIHN